MVNRLIDRRLPRPGTRAGFGVGVGCVPLVARCIAVLAVCFAAPATAQSELGDPTRPPIGVTSAAEDRPQVATAVLQSVLIPEKGKPSAIIGGRQVRLGELYGENRLTRLTEREAVLVGPDGTTRLLLIPGVSKSETPARKPNTISAGNTVRKGNR